MQTDWLKASATYTMTGAGHENGVRHTFANVAQAATAEQIMEFGNILESLTSDTIIDVTVSQTNHILAK
ncbi:hypothetical protein [Lentilactobacillus laojiaonis]|uniref:DUF1659 domain-containing protein n=1 Tax=Lentilactobacillus laojiaonis TaxID=2883998 RepID=UPI001D0ACAA6|nr:hypothetical protein [Lentilactobacillus laojiaonis]UDM32045.1 hypothetical protein LHL71_05825 [Lentilactobacillus laojiaonis]